MKQLVLTLTDFVTLLCPLIVVGRFYSILLPPSPSPSACECNKTPPQTTMMKHCSPNAGRRAVDGEGRNELVFGGTLSRGRLQRESEVRPPPFPESPCPESCMALDTKLFRPAEEKTPVAKRNWKKKSLASDSGLLRFSGGVGATELSTEASEAPRRLESSLEPLLRATFISRRFDDIPCD